MSVNQWDWLLASADGLLTTEDCSKLLDAELFTDDYYDLLKTFPSAAPKSPQSLYPSSPRSPLSPAEIKPSRADLASDLLQQLDTQPKQENIFSNWLEEKVDLPIFENISQLPERVEVAVPPILPVPVPAPVYITPQPTEELLREFETVYGAVELTHLTPPQSPPGPASQLLQSYAQAHGIPAAPLLLAPAQEQWEVIPDNHYVDLEEVEELVRKRASELQSPQPSGSSTSTSPHSSPPSSPRSSDDDWCAPPQGKRRSRATDDRRSRKKEQNKNAATRYRQKKKAEIEVLLSEENTLRQRHTDLGNKCSDLQREIRYLKGLMRDLFKAKGLIK